MFAKWRLRSGTKKLDSAQKEEGEKADERYKEAISIFESIVGTEPTVLDALHNWGLTLASQASKKTGQEAEDLFNKAYEKYTACLIIDPRNSEVLNDWGAAIMDQARTGNAGPEYRLYEQATDRFQQAEQLIIGVASYNLACIASLRNESESCGQHLKTARETGNLPSVDDMQNDIDLSNVREAEWFQEFINSIPR